MSSLTKRYCCVYGCLNSSVSNPALSFFKLPTDAERRDIWLILMLREDLVSKRSSSYCVCDTHFSTQDILPTGSRKILKKNSIPSLNLPERKDLQRAAQVILPLVEEAAQTTFVTASVKDEPLCENKPSCVDEPSCEDEPSCVDEPSCEVPVGFECRICAKVNTAMVPIFEEDGLKNDLAGLINKYLPISVSKTDQKSQHTCLNCLQILEKWDRLTETCAKTDEHFRNREPEEKKNLLKRTDLFLDINPVNFNTKSLCLRDLSRAPPKTFFEKQLPSIVCRKCNFEFYGKECMDAHFCICKELQCYRCLHLFQSLRSIYLHFVSCNSYVCRGCTSVLSSRTALRQHERYCRTPAAKVPLQCKRCDEYRTRCPEDYENHVLGCDAVNHLDIIVPAAPRKDNCLACQLCLRLFGSVSELVKHVGTCSLFVCECTAMFHSLADLVEHGSECDYVVVSSSFEAEQYTCEVKRPIPALADREVSFKSLWKRAPAVEEPTAVISDEEGCAGAEDGGRESPYEASSQPEAKSALDHYEAEMEDLFAMLQRESFTENSHLQCYLCKFVFESKIHLRDHLMINHHAAKLLTSRYVCEICKTQCRSIDAFNLHSYNRHTSRICTYCKEQFPTVMKLTLHLKEQHFKGNKMGCQICRKIFLKTEMPRHREWHYLEEKLSCEVCQKVVIGVKRYAIHMCKHRCNKPILCFECGAMVPKYQQSQHLLCHRKKPEKGAPVVDRRERVECEVCGRMIVTSKLLWHMRRMHSVDSSENHQRTGKSKFVCLECNRSFSQKNLLVKHMHGHEIGITPRSGFKCHFCAMGYNTKKNLDSHIISCHQFEEPHCAICDIRFETIQEKYLHMRMEHSYMKFEFLCCGLYFAKLSQFQSHFFERHDDGETQSVGRYKDKTPTPYRYQLTYAKNDKGEPRIKVACGHCGKETINMVNNNLHIRNIHIGIRPYHCSFCPQAFKTQNSLTHHEYIHLDLKPYKCSKCPQTFRQPTDMKKHEKRHDRDYAFSDVTVVPRKRKRFEHYTA